MDQTALVDEDIAAGCRLLAGLDGNLQLEAAFWWKEDDIWRLVLATPLVHEKGPRFVYSSIRDIIESTAGIPRSLFDRIEVVSPSAGLVTVLDLGGEGQLPWDRLILNESIHSVYVAGAYFYKFQPGTFAKAS